MPIPGGEITTTEIWNTPAAAEEANIPFEKIEAEEDAEDLAAYDAAVADPDPGIPLEKIKEEK